MGAIAAKLRKPIRRFNVDNRAQRVISKEKPVPAPQHAATAKQIKAAMEASPNFMETHNKKDAELDMRLKSVFVTSIDPQEKYANQNLDRPLPQSRTSKPELEFGLHEPNEIPKGKCSLQQLVDLLSQHKEDPVKCSSSALADKYKLDKQVVENLIEYYKLYKIAIPEKIKQELEKRKKVSWLGSSVKYIFKQKSIDEK